MTQDKELPDVIRFLLGEGQLDGMNYGDRPASKPMFWWRAALKEAWNTRTQDMSEIREALQEGAIAKAAYLGEDYNPEECQIQALLNKMEGK